MKLLFVFLFSLLTFVAHAQKWPLNPNNKIEIIGNIPWPATAKTEAQRQALVRRWYLAKLTVLTASQIEASSAVNKTNGLLTYAGLPKAIVMRQVKGENEYLLDYFAQLTAVSSGLNYRFTRFNIGLASDVDTASARPLEQVLLKATPNEQAALAALRKRLAVAVAGW